MNSNFLLILNNRLANKNKTNHNSFNNRQVLEQSGWLKPETYNYSD